MIQDKTTKQMRNPRKEKLGREVLENCRNELYSYFPYLDGAFVELPCKADWEQSTIATDGEHIYFNPEYLLEIYVKDSRRVCRGYLHILLHCLYLQLFERKQDQYLWDLACDITVEQIIERERVDGLELPVSPIREKVFRQLEGRSIFTENIYEMLKRDGFSFTSEELAAEFSFDDHSIWQEELDDLKVAKTRRKWEKILAYTGQNKNEKKRRMGTLQGWDEDEVEQVHKSRYDYRRFLKKFAQPREEIELDTESFDYIFYNYGMEHYGNMPLIEPLEYKEVNRLEELVIAIDTSGSCSRETVQQFLAETYSILSQRENFFRKMKVYILQCDCCIQDAAVIHSEEEWKDYMKNMKIYGRGGTNFCPVFQYVEDLKKRKEIRNLKALIYFTDGDGVYPRCRPDYETAFVFLRKTARMDLVPPWALRLIAEDI